IKASSILLLFCLDSMVGSFMGINRIILVGFQLLLLVWLQACLPFSLGDGGKMKPAEAYQLMKDGKAILVDVREEDELKASGIAEGAQWMPLSQFEERSQEWEEFQNSLPKDKKIVFYCHSGGRSGRIAEYLRQEGYDTANAGG